MLFNSLQFLFFFPICVALYFSAPSLRVQRAGLFLLGCVFYMAFIPKYLLILFFLILVDYGAGLLIERDQPGKKLWLLSSVAANLGVLFFFKYSNFPKAPLLLPIGLSFHVFQSLSYTIEVYRGGQKAERNLLSYALYVLFWPQLVAGPIERPQHLLPQLRTRHVFDADKAVSGLRLMLVGFIKKIVIADSLALLVGRVYGDVADYHGLSVGLATLFFSFQILCDFSGYTDIARGAARVLGFELIENFNAPYLARSIAEFWRRWHVSLSSWFRDYLYIFVLGGNRVGPARHSLNLLVVFLLSGLWHGANWTFLIWGLLHFAYFIAWPWLERMVRSKALQTVLTFSFVTFAWIFFRADTAQHAFTVVSNLFSFKSGEPLAFSVAELVDAALLIALVLAWDSGLLRGRLKNLFKVKAFRWALYYAGIAGLLFLGRFDARQFIYFQF